MVATKTMVTMATTTNGEIESKNGRDNGNKNENINDRHRRQQQ